MKKDFYLGDIEEKKIARIYIKRSYTNIFLTLTDLNNKVIISKTSGNTNTKIRNKRKKKIPQTVERIVYYLKEYFELYEITYLHLVVKMRVKAHVYTLMSKLSSYGIKVISMISKRSIAHNGVKGRKLRRL